MESDSKNGGDKTPKTPNTDMQAEDTGTADSGAAEESGRGAAAEGAMKETSKTDIESDSQR